MVVAGRAIMARFERYLDPLSPHQQKNNKKIKFSEMDEKAGCFAIIVLQIYCYYKCYVALPHGDVGLSAVCDCDIS